MVAVSSVTVRFDFFFLLSAYLVFFLGLRSVDASIWHPATFVPIFVVMIILQSSPPPVFCSGERTAIS